MLCAKVYIAHARHFILQIRNAALEDSGDYECQVTSPEPADTPFHGGGEISGPPITSSAAAKEASYAPNRVLSQKLEINVFSKKNKKGYQRRRNRQKSSESRPVHFSSQERSHSALTSTSTTTTSTLAPSFTTIEARSHPMRNGENKVKKSSQSYSFSESETDEAEMIPSLIQNDSSRSSAEIEAEEDAPSGARKKKFSPVQSSQAASKAPGRKTTSVLLNFAIVAAVLLQLSK